MSNGKEAELKRKLDALEITCSPTTIRIAALYIHLIEATHAFFLYPYTTALDQKSFNAKVQAACPRQITSRDIEQKLPAIKRKDLSNHLFKEGNKHGVLAYIIPAIDNIHLNQILPDHEDWNNKREEFYQTHPITKHAVTTTVLNFWNNIAQCCGRVLADWRTVSSVFFPKEPIQQLTEIEVTDSDPHKGGKQVLILTFDLGKKLVYKPSDLELDCLLIGQSDSQNNDLRDFFAIGRKKTQSVMEIVNAEIRKAGETKLHPLPTYKILPRNPGSRNANDQIRESYGYLEFLSNGEKILSGDEKQKILARDDACSAIAGQLTALAMTFSLTDLHGDNVIIRLDKLKGHYTPYLIDLETSLAQLTKTIGDTQLHLWIFDLKTAALVPAYVETLKLLESLKKSKLSNWCQRMNNVITRIVPFGTPNLLGVLDEVYTKKTKPLVLDERVRYAIQKQRFDEQIFSEPKHLLIKHQQFIEDFMNMDVPVFYHRIGTTHLLDSRGVQVKLGLPKEYFVEDPFGAIKREQIDGLRPERIRELMNDQYIKMLFSEEKIATLLQSIEMKKRS